MKEARQLRLRVECYAGYRAEEEPRRFFIGEREVAVDTILDRWLDPEHHYFKVRGSDHAIYILRNTLSDGHWELTMYDSGHHDDTRLSAP